MNEWSHFFPKLINFRKVYKNCNVPIKWDTDQSFADWVYQLRKSKSKLPKSVKDQLIEVNFNFDYRYFEWLLFYQQLKDFKHKHHHIRVPSTTSKYQSLFSWISRQRKRKEKLSKEQISMLDALGFIWNMQQVRDTKWMENFKKLQAHKRRFGDANAPLLHKNDRSLAMWLQDQREFERDQKLPLERMQMLTQLGVKWNSEHDGRKNLTDKIWKKKLKKLSDYKARYGHTNVPASWKEDRLFSRWVGELRLEYKKGLLPKDRIDDLVELDFEFEPINEKEWALMLTELRNFRERFHHLEVPKDKAAYFSLAQWMDYIRTKIRQVTPAQRKELNEIGFEWRPIDEAWIGKYTELKIFKEKYGHTRILRTAEYKQLHSWVLHLRNRTNGLSERKIKLLDAIGFEWVIKGKFHEQQWQANYEMLKAYKIRFGHCRIPEGWRENPTLANWVQSQRDSEESLSIDKRTQLDLLGFTWSRDIDAEKEGRWNEIFEKVKSHYEATGNFIIPTDSKEGHSLMIWISNQRVNKRKGVLSDEKIAKLNSISFIWEGRDQVKLRNSSLWEENYHKLQLFFQAHGNCNVSPKVDASLNAWVVAQRKAEKKLSEDQWKKLDSINFDWAKDKKNEIEIAWMNKFNELVAFKEKFGHCTVSLKTEGYSRLGGWAQKQRGREKEGKLSQDRKDKLEKLGFVFSGGVEERMAISWKKKIEALKDFKTQHGHIKVPPKGKQHLSLGIWLDNLKRRYNSISPEKKHELEELGFKI